MSATLTSPKPVPTETPQAESVITPIRWKPLIVMASTVVISLILFISLMDSDKLSRLVLSDRNDKIQLPVLSLPSMVTNIALMVLAGVLAAVAAFFVMNRRRIPKTVSIGFTLLVVIAFLLWVISGNDHGLQITFLLATTVTASLPFIFGALSGLVCERAGIINISIEAQMMAGAFMAAVMATVSGNPYIGLISAPIAGMLVGGVLSVFSIKYRVDQIIVGVVLNFLVLGITNYLHSTVLSGNSSGLNNPRQLVPIKIPLISDIPIIGKPLFNQSIVVYLMYLSVFGLGFMLFRSRWGLRVRAVGEHPKAADTVGINVNRTRYRNVALGSALASFGGASLVAAGLPFIKDITAGRGFIALAAMILGRWKPNGALAAGVLFGFADSLRRVLGNAGAPVPPDLLAMLPYLATLFVVAGVVGRIRPPAAEGIPYP